MEITDRKLTRQEAHDLAVLIRERARVLKAAASEQAAICLADFEKQISAIYEWDQDEVWKSAVEGVLPLVKEAEEKIAQRCSEMGIPKQFAPHLTVAWTGRGQSAVAERRTELRRAAKAEIDMMEKAAITKIEKQAVDLRTHVISLGVVSADAKMFLESLAPIEENMRGLEFTTISERVEIERKKMNEHYKRLGYRFAS